MNFVVVKFVQSQFNFQRCCRFWSIPPPSLVTSTDSILKQEQGTTIRVADAVVLQKKMLTNPTTPGAQNKSVSDHKSGEAWAALNSTSRAEAPSDGRSACSVLPPPICGNRCEIWMHAVPPLPSVT
jgi:hypothetical protein